MANEAGIGALPSGLAPDMHRYLSQVQRLLRTGVTNGTLTPGGGSTGSGSAGGGTTIIVGGGSGGSSEPDYTPPPTPDGVTVNAGFSSVFITTATPSFTVGNGYLRTHVYGAKWPLTDAVGPSFTSAQVIHQFTGSIGSFPTDLGTRWALWVKWESNDGVLSASPAGSAGGFIAQTGKIGNADLGPLIVEAGNLASGAVTAAKLAAQAIDATKFANGIEPVAIVAALPAVAGYAGPKTILLSTDSKLYRFTGSAWTKSTDGADITANSITAGQIAAGAIRATEIAAGAIRANHLLVAPKSLNPDPDFQQGAAGWSGFVQRLTASNAAVPTGCPKGFAAQFQQRDNPWHGGAITCKSGEQYRLSVWVNNGGGSGGSGVGILIYGYDTTGVITYAAGFAATTANGWQFQSGAWAVPAGVVGFVVGPWMDKTAFVGNAWFTDLNIEKLNDASLIVDGAIVATKIAAGAIAVGSAAIENGAIRNALIADAAIDSLKVADAAIVTAKIADAAITNAKINDLSADKITAGLINANRIGADSITADKIDSRGLSIKDASGNIILAAGSSLPNSYGPTSNGENLWTGNLSQATGSLDGGAIVSTGFTDPRGGSSGVVVRLPVAPSYVYYRIFYAAGRPDAWYTCSIKLYVVSGMSIVVSATNGSSWDASNFRVASTTSTTPVWVQVTIRQFVRGSDGGLDFVIGSYHKTGLVTSSSPSFTEVAVADLVVYKDQSIDDQNPITPANVSTYIANAAIKSAQIESLAAGKVAVTSGLSDISGNVGLLRTAASGGRTEIEPNRMQVFDSNGVLRVKIGYLL